MTDSRAVQITVQVRLDTARALHDQRLASPAAEELAAVVGELGSTVEPVHPGVDDPQLATYFTVEAASMPEADRLLERLRSHPAILAAYIKPADELP
jgi:hypothetical protein